MENRYNFSFRMDALTPEKLPMGRLAKYMANLSQLLGAKKYVHAVGIEDGSVKLAIKIDELYTERAIQRVLDVGQGEGSRQAVSAFEKINEHLYEDGSEGQLSDSNGAKILYFPGHYRPVQVGIGPFEQEDSLDGIIISVGEKTTRAKIPVWLQSGDDKILCFTKLDVAKKLARYLFERELRIFGTAKRFRDTEGRWRFSRFIITDFTPLNTTPLTTLVEQLRSIPGNGWEKLKDPWRELQRERED